MSLKTPRIMAAVGSAAAVLALTAPSAFAYGDDTAVPLSIDGATISADGPSVSRIAGDDRIATAIKAFCSRADWRTRNNPGDTWWADSLILASSNNYADALASGPLADILDAPILVTPDGDALDKRIVSLLVLGCDGKKDTADDRPIKNVTITSGTGVLTDKVVRQLLAAPVWLAGGVLDTTKGAGISGDVDRYAGLNRYQTATAIAKRIDVTAFRRGYDNLNVFIADGDNFPDALAAGAAAAEKNGVVLLTMGANGLDNTGFEFASNFAYSGKMIQNHNEVYAVGGNAAKAVKKGFNGVPVEPSFTVVGTDRYDTSALLANKVFDSPEDFIVASGEVSSDAVFAGGFAANLDAPLLLTASGSLSPQTGAYLKSAAQSNSRIIVFGGPGSVTPHVSGQLVELLATL